MKKVSLLLLSQLFTGNRYHSLNASKLFVIAMLLCGLGNRGLAQQTTINISTPTVISAANACPGASNVNIYAFEITGVGVGAVNSVTAVSFSNTGTAVVPGDVVQYKLWKNAGGGTGSLVATSTTTTFSGISTEVFTNGTVTDYWITADIANTPTTGNTITVATMNSSNLTATGPAAGTGTVSGGTQTIVATPTVTGLTALPTPICSGNNLTLTATGATGTGVLVSYNWSGPNGYVASSATSPHTYVVPNEAASGVYNVTVTYPGANCTSMPVASSNVTVNGTPNLPASMYICNNVPAASTILNSGSSAGGWSSGNNAVATVDPTTGAVWPVGAPGTSTTITQNTTGLTNCGVTTTTITIATRPSRIYGPTVGGTQYVCTGSQIVLSSATTGGTWTSAFPSIASVTNGAPTNKTTVTGGNLGTGSGTTTVIYTNPVTGCDTTIAIDVNPTPNPILTATTWEVCRNSTLSLFDATPFGAWSSSNSAQATVTPGGGVVTGVSVGNPTITYSVAFPPSACYVTHTVQVNPLPGVVVGPSFLCTGLTTTYTDASAPAGTWSSASSAVATINVSTGVAGGVTAGFTNIIYTLNATGCQQSLLLQVNQQPGPITGTDSVCAGDATQLSDAPVGGLWTSSNMSVATVDPTGLVFGLHTGPVPATTTITYSVTSCNAVSTTVKVNPAPGPMQGIPDVCVGFTTSLSDTIAGGVWTNSNPSIDTFTTAPTIRGVSVGFSVITYTLPTQCYITQVFLVNPNPDSITGPDTVCQGAIAILSDATPGGTWSSTNLAISQIVDSSGVDTGISAGTVNISYTLPTGCYATIPFRVKPPVVASVSMTKYPAGLTCAGTVDTFVTTELNGGIPTYQWYKFTTPVAPPNGQGPNDTLAPVNGDLIVVQMTTHFSCAIDTIVYDSLVANVYPPSGPVDTITASPPTTMRDHDTLIGTAGYLGEVFTFFSNTTFAGTSPVYQWYMNGVAIPGANSLNYNTPVYVDDTFWCKMTSNAPCDIGLVTVTSNPIIIRASYLGVAPLALSNSNLALFPNPSTGSITLSGTTGSAVNSDLDIEISDMLGHIVYKGKATPQNGYVKQQINLDNNLASGTYLLHVYAESLNQVFRFVISK